MALERMPEPSAPILSYMMNHGPEGLARDPKVRHGAHPHCRVARLDALVSQFSQGVKQAFFLFCYQ